MLCLLSSCVCSTTDRGTGRPYRREPCPPSPAGCRGRCQARPQPRHRPLGCGVTVWQRWPLGHCLHTWHGRVLLYTKIQRLELPNWCCFFTHTTPSGMFARGVIRKLQPWLRLYFLARGVTFGFGWVF